MPNARLVWVEECGHVPHLEQPTKAAAEIVDFIKNGNPAKVHKFDSVMWYRVHQKAQRGLC